MRRPAFGRDGRLVPPAGLEPPELLRDDGVTLQRRLRGGEISSVELATACLDRIEALNPTYNAVVSLRPRADILAEAREADERRASGGTVSALHGLPIAIKDLAATAGLRTTWGSPLFSDHVPAEDDLHVGRIRQAGAIIVGKTNVPEYGLGSHTYNPVFGPTRNAYLPELSAGGSSGGAAVALALAMLPVADGSDFGGSLRNPGAWNNVFGFRPSQGRVPTVPAQDPFYAQLATNGPMGRSVADLAAMLTVMAGYDPRAPLSLATEPEPFEAGLAPKEAPRIAWLADLDGRLPFEPGILDLCQAALRDLEPAGWQIEPVSVPFPWADLWESFVTLRHWAMSSRYGEVYADLAKRALLKPEMTWEIEGGFRLGSEDISAAARTRAKFYQVALKLFERFDALALPTAQVFPFPIDWRWPQEVAGVPMDSYHRWMEVVVIGTLSGCPVVNVPAGFDERGRPMGIQLVGRPRADRELLAIAAAYERDAARAGD
ncbi:amidase [Enterovirga aerilata]|uniref:Indoleacetamide hydrolase n=1 Tax=Enterovirga aerilata TaxID=2730920 RepID=A0A849I616_9HYPH|nr:amidase [Enterovirga sp. DB1703]NNM71540.1 amidase [Enterovirga sp. DB1703]